MPNNTLILIMAVTAGTFLQAATGFGLSIVVMAVIPVVIPIADSAALLLLANGITLLSITIKYFKHIRWRMTLFPQIFSFAGMAIGVKILTSLDNTVAIKGFGVFLLLLSVYFCLFSKRIKFPCNLFSSALAGFLSGFFSGFINIAGPPMVLYYSAAIKDKKEYMATSQAFFLMSAICKFLFHLIFGGFPQTVIQYIPYVLVATFAGLILGNLTFDRLPTEHVKKAVYGAMAIAGIFYIVK